MATAQKRLRDPSDRIARRLLGEGRVSRELYEAALRHRQARGIRIEEALIEAGMGEKQLLTVLAEMYRVQYISSIKLSSASIDKRTLALVPVQIAEQRQVVPVLLDRQRSILSVVTSDPDDIEAMKELEIASQVRTIRALVARPAAVEAAVRKFYQGDDFAFALLRNDNSDVARAIERDPLVSLQTPHGEQMLTERGVVPRGGEKAEPSAMAPATPFSAPPAYFPGRPSHPSLAVGSNTAPRSPTSYSMDLPAVEVPQTIASYPSAPLSGAGAGAGARAPATLGFSPALPSPTEPAPLSFPLPRGETRPIILTPPPPPSAAPPDSRPAPDSDSPLPPTLSPAYARAQPRPLPELEDVDVEPLDLEDLTPLPEGNTSPSPFPPVLTNDEAIGDPFQLALVLVSLLEGNRKDLRGHSLQTARLVRTVCERFNVSPMGTRAAEIAALVHDLGKASSYHLTPYNVARFAGHHAAAQKLYTTPMRVLESAGLADAAANAVNHMYERYDGTGFPDMRKGNEIPLESRILAICDSYTDLTSNPRNSFRKVLNPQEACEALREMMGSVFDPKVVDRFSRAVLGDDIAQKIRGDRGTVLLVDPHVEETTVLELSLIETHYDVHVARAIDEATRFVESGGVDVVVSEMVLDPGTGFELLAKVRSLPGGENIPFVFLSGETDGTKVAAALDAGAVDYLFKPLATEIVVAKIRRLLEQAQSKKHVRGVSGSLEEMGITDIVQILNQGRKTGALHLTLEGEQGSIFFSEGNIVDAIYRGSRGEEAFYALVSMTKGGFTIDPSAVPPEKIIHASPEMLLLEGMRRIDEAKR